MPRRRLACQHESAHALARWYHGHGMDRVIVLTTEEVRAGVQVENRRGALATCEGFIDAYDICGYPFGRLKIEGTAKDQAECDRIRAISRDIDLINCLASFYAEANYRRVSIAAAMLAGGLDDMRMFNMILDAWDLDGDQRAAVSQAAEARTAALVRSPQGSTAIRAIADALMADGELTGEQVSDLCREAYGGRACAYGAWMSQWPPTLEQIRAGHIPERPARFAA